MDKADTPAAGTLSKADTARHYEAQVGAQEGGTPRTDAVEIKTAGGNVVYSDFARELERSHAELVAALKNLELGANTVDACYSRNPGNFAAALRDLREYAEAARAALAKATGA